MGTIVVGTLLFLIVSFIIGKIIKDKKHGKSIGGCDGNCSHCSGDCH